MLSWNQMGRFYMAIRFSLVFGIVFLFIILLFDIFFLPWDIKNPFEQILRIGFLLNISGIFLGILMLPDK